jgi:hypothetical protein
MEKCCIASTCLPRAAEAARSAFVIYVPIHIVRIQGPEHCCIRRERAPRVVSMPVKLKAALSSFILVVLEKSSPRVGETRLNSTTRAKRRSSAARPGQNTSFWTSRYSLLAGYELLRCPSEGGQPLEQWSVH